MPDRQNLGEILRGLGRISLDEQNTALEYQKEHGGFFGEALIHLGFLTSDELEFGLASQFDLPYIFPDPDAIDREVAFLVSPEWALTNLALPISRAGDTLVVVVDSPLKDELMMALSHRTGLEVEMAIASPDKIRKLIREIFTESAEEARDGFRPALSVDAFLERALGEGASAIGISIRGRIAIGWWRSGAMVQRAALAGGWVRGFEARVLPADGLFSTESESAGEAGRRKTPRDASLLWEGLEIPVRISLLGTGDQREILFSLVKGDDEISTRFPPPPNSLVKEVRLLSRSGSSRFGFRALPEELRQTLLPALPELLFGRDIRSAHLAPAGGEDEELEGRLVLPLPDPTNEDSLEAFLDQLRTFRFDALTVEAPDDPAFWANRLTKLTSALFVSLPSPEFRGPLREAGVPWEIEARKSDDGEFGWRLFPLNISY